MGCYARSCCGYTEPKFNGAFGVNLTYREWSLFASFLYEWGGQEYNQTLVDRVENAAIERGNVDLRVFDRSLAKTW